MISWSPLIAHTISAIALQFMRGLYDSQNRHLISNTTYIIYIFLLFFLQILKFENTHQSVSGYIIRTGVFSKKIGRENKIGWEK